MGRFFIASSIVVIASLGMNSAWAAGGSDAEIVAKINAYVRQGWKENEVEPSEHAADGEWVRRVSLDVVGHIPSFDRLMDYLEDRSTDKRAKFVDRLLEDPDYVRHWTNLWGNLLVGRAGNRRGGRAALERWLRRELHRNTPYDKFVYALVSAEGSVQKNGAVAYLAGQLNDGAVPATSRTSRIFLGMQVQCTQCHNHPFNKWKQEQFWAMNGFFRGTRRGRGDKRGQFSLTDNPTKSLIFFENRQALLKVTPRRFVDGTAVKMDAESKPRQQLAKLITDPSKPYMANAAVNRMWGHFFGYGFTRPVDDMGPHNPPSHPELLAYLATQFKEAGYDVKRLIRWITLSEAYGLSSKFGEKNAADKPSAGNTPLFSRMYLKQFTAEQLYDSLLIATDADKAGRTSGAAEKQRQTWLRQFVQAFGTDENDEATTFDGTIPQALLLMNGALIQSAVGGKQGGFLKKVLDSPGGDLRALKKRKPARRRPRRLTRAQLESLRKKQLKSVPQRIETLFLVALARQPSTAELEALDKAYQEGKYTDPVAGLQDLFWAILNSNEFITNH
ncbi:MAG: DUF1549 and DUF1553 domain-containing protein [Planctomycetaceae bacterium]